jgi:2-polyprenyl-3-methyl-5-hydroxy-6-metoxy-1,4-benzoquinol methylase
MAKDADEVRDDWDRAADAYALGQANGRDYYRLEFFGPPHIALCGDVGGVRLLDVGCGAGYFSRAMAERGATVTGVDLSPRMIEHARAGGGEIDYRVIDAAAIGDAFAPASFDVVTSCLALQDMPEPWRVLAAIRRVLRPGGRLVASIEHPCGQTPFRQWERAPDGTKRWLCIDRYYERTWVPYTWRNWAYEFTTSAYHAPLEDWFAWLRDAGLVVRDLREPRPTAEALRAHPDLEDAARVPYFLMFVATATTA